MRALLIVLAAALAAVSCTPAGPSPFFRPETHVATMGPETISAAATLPVDDYLQIAVKAPAPGAAPSAEASFGADILRYGGFQWIAPERTSQGFRDYGQAVYSFVAKAPGETVVELPVVGPDATDEPPRRVAVTVTPR